MGSLNTDPTPSKSLIEIFEEGMTARDRGLTCEDNPYWCDTPEYQAWDEGCTSSLGLENAGKSGDADRG
jgi:hypothetical protein